MKLAIVIIVILAVVGVIVYFLVRSNEDNTKDSPKNNITQTTNYKNVLPAELNSLLATKEDIFLLDVHIPEQEHIIGTDSFIPYNELVKNVTKLPQDKDAPIVVYCRSGSMSITASEELIDLGYTNVSNLVGGIKAWRSYIN